jgi:hypothetical protein
VRQVKRYDGKLEDQQYRLPTGRLRLYIERSYGKATMYEDGTNRALEGRLNDVLVAIAKQVVKCREQEREKAAAAELAAVRAAERAAEEERRREVERLARLERERRAALVSEAETWRRAAEIRAYVGVVQVSVESVDEAARARIEEWARWAIGVAEEMDPIGKRLGAGAFLV